MKNINPFDGFFTVSGSGGKTIIRETVGALKSAWLEPFGDLI